MEQSEAVNNIEGRCSIVKHGQAIDIPLDIFHTAYGPPDQSLEDVIDFLKKKYDFNSHELNRTLGVLRLIKRTELQLDLK